MARQPNRIEFRTFNDMAAHLDGWAAASLGTPGAWEDVLVASRPWLDYSARNQVLLASYGVDGVVGGPETWRLVPSTHEGRPCAVRAGEHGYPVRVPVTTGGSEPDPYLGGTRPTRAAVERWEWRPVFEVAQLARRPAPGAVVPTDLPAALTGPGAHDEMLRLTRRVATSTVRGRLPKNDDTAAVLAEAAARLTRSPKRPALDPVLGQQVAWMVHDRVGLAAESSPPPFDPESLPPRERWERLQDVLEPARKLTAALGVVTGVDLLASPLPRMSVIDDRVVPASRRHRLPAASLEQLPVGHWVDVGPYTAAEWASRGEDATGRGTYLRLNKTAYLVAVEQGDTAAWRLEDVAERTGDGLLAQGSARSLEQARTQGLAVLDDRYPALAPHRSAALTVVPAGTTVGWEQMPGEGSTKAQMKRLDAHVTAYACTGPGGRWMPGVLDSRRGLMERLPLTKTLDEAQMAAELAGRRAIRVASMDTPAAFDPLLAAFAGSDDYSRRELTALLGSRLDPEDRARLPGAGAAELADLAGAAGASPATIVAILAAEQVDARQAAGLLPTIGVPMADAITVLNERWELSRPDASELLGATAAEMREAGCPPAEILAVRPREVLRALPEDPHLWELAAGTMATAGHPPPVIVAHLLAHAPTVDAFAAGITSGIDAPGDGLALAVRAGAPGEHLAALSEAYGLAPGETALVLADLRCTATVLLDTLAIRCDGDLDAAVSIGTDVAGITSEATAAWLDPPVPAPQPVHRWGGLDLGDATELLADLPPASDRSPPTVDSDFGDLTLEASRP